jgi:hypothetical protein
MSQTKTQFVATEEWKSQQKEKVKQTLEKLVNVITSDHVVDDITKVIIKGDRPCDSWSLRNKLLMLSQGTTDARSFNAWKAVGRYVKAGSKAIYIVKPYNVPIQIEKKNEKGEVIGKEEIYVFGGFTFQNEFKYEDTDGKELAYKKHDELPDLTTVAKKWGYSVEFDDTHDQSAYGYHDLQNKKIVLGVREKFADMIFFHELAHAAFKKIDPEAGALYSKNIILHKKEETIVQLSACVLAKLYGIDCEGFTQEYIANQIHTKNLKTVANAIGQVLDRVDQVVNLILYERQAVMKEELGN